jgi:hypothetical protein
MNAIDAARSSIPARLYLFLMHRGATTGFLPRLNHDGTPTGEFDVVASDDRMRLLQYLTNKVLPDLRTIEVRQSVSAEEGADTRAITTMTTEELRLLAAGEAQDDPDTALAPSSAGAGGDELALPDAADCGIERGPGTGPA